MGQGVRIAPVADLTRDPSMAPASRRLPLDPPTLPWPCHARESVKEPASRGPFGTRMEQTDHAPTARETGAPTSWGPPGGAAPRCARIDPAPGPAAGGEVGR